MLDETKVTELILRGYMEDLLKNITADVVIVGAGPSGLTAAYYLAREKKKVVVFDRRLSIGGGMWAGGMFFNKIVVEERGREILDEIGILYEKKEKYYVADAIHAVSALGYMATKVGAKIFNAITVEDVILRDERVEGVVINWSTAKGYPVDPLVVKSRFVVDATGHEATVVDTLVRKNDIRISTPSGRFEGEHSLYMEIAESIIEENAREVYPGLYVTGMAANAVFGSPRTGPIFGGMFLSGRKVAKEILKRL